MKYGRIVPLQLAADECPFCDWDSYLRDRRAPEGRHGESTTEPRKLFVSLARFKRHVADHQEKLAIFSVSKWVTTEEEDDEQIQSDASERISEHRDTEEYRVPSPRVPTTSPACSKGSRGEEMEPDGDFGEPRDPQDLAPQLIRETTEQVIPSEIQGVLEPYNDDDLFSQYLHLPNDESPAYIQLSADGRDDTSTYLGSEGQAPPLTFGQTLSSSSYTRASPSSPVRLEDADSQAVPIASWPESDLDDLDSTDALRHVQVPELPDNNPIITNSPNYDLGKRRQVLCRFDGCTKRHVHAIIDDIKIVSQYCQEHTCQGPRDTLYGFCATPRDPAQKCCPQHGKCTVLGCTRQAPREISRNELPFICPERESCLNLFQGD